MGGDSLVSHSWQVLNVEIAEPLHKAFHGYQLIFVVSNCLSFALFFLMCKSTAAAIVKYFEDSLCWQHGVPDVLITENGVQFLSKEYTYSGKCYCTSYYLSQANSTEKINRVLKTVRVSYTLSKLLSQHSVLAKVGWPVQSAKHEVIYLTHYFINFGREMILKKNAQKSRPRTDKPMQVETADTENFGPKPCIGFIGMCR
ncbi:hypothetical protein QE152_g29668 [Popillia japonica]|uniref:Integrase catalytic domain-containing protein n=1 Tax=Popillia japonica TaxID=7064 RepID=A0AAW1JH85_POPJA